MRRKLPSVSHLPRRRFDSTAYRNSSTKAHASKLRRNTGNAVISPLLHFESAVLRYPSYESNYVDSTVPASSALKQDSNHLEYRLEADIQRYHDNSDLLLEAEEALQLNDTAQLRHLQPHWDKHLASAEIEQELSSLHLQDLQIYPNSACKSVGGGHILLGTNGSGKTLISKCLIHQFLTAAGSIDYNSFDNNPYLQSGSLHTYNSSGKSHSQSNTSSRYTKSYKTTQILSNVSFESHSQLLHSSNQPISVHRALIPNGGNRLSPTAQFLIVRLGMYPLLPRTIDTLSTGEIRRVLLVRALVTKPSLLLLDNVMDGLDLQGRIGVQNILERVLDGFRMDILVQGVSAKDAARTQVVLSTLRAEEISKGFDVVTFVDGERVRTEERKGRSAVDLLTCLNPSDDVCIETNTRQLEEMKVSNAFNAHSTCYLPTATEINNFWESGKNESNRNEVLLVKAEQLSIIRDDTILLSNLDWIVQRGDRWHLAGTNGAGKSTLGRLLLRKSMNASLLDSNNDATIMDGSLAVTTQQQSHEYSKRGGVGWVSTELHLHAAKNWMDRTVADIMCIGTDTLFDLDRDNRNNKDRTNNLVDLKAAIAALQWVGLVERFPPNNNNHAFLWRKFSTLSQGQQKLLLLASSIAQRPSLLILDEPCQGLDIWNRAQVLGLLDLICENTDMALIYITHHEDELIRGIDKVLRLEDGKAVYCGVR